MQLFRCVWDLLDARRARVEHHRDGTAAGGASRRRAAGFVRVRGRPSATIGMLRGLQIGHKEQGRPGTLTHNTKDGQYIVVVKTSENDRKADLGGLHTRTMRRRAVDAAPHGIAHEDQQTNTHYESLGHDLCLFCRVSEVAL